jgi:hypothetical protein
VTTRTFDLTDQQGEPGPAPQSGEALPERPQQLPEPGAGLAESPGAALSSSDSPYDLLRARVQSRTAPKPVEYEVPRLDGCSVLYDVSFEWEQLQAWRMAARDPETGIPDPMRVALTVMTNSCRAIRFNGKTVRLNGEPRRFHHDDIQDMLGAAGTADAVRKLYANDAHVLITGEKIVAAAGYGDVVAVRREEDPTSGSSGA